jgi:hypothetical protein
VNFKLLIIYFSITSVSVSGTTWRKYFSFFVYYLIYLSLRAKTYPAHTIKTKHAQTKNNFFSSKSRDCILMLRISLLKITVLFEAAACLNAFHQKCPPTRGTNMYIRQRNFRAPQYTKQVNLLSPLSGDNKISVSLTLSLKLCTYSILNISKCNLFLLRYTHWDETGLQLMKTVIWLWFYL